MSLLTTREPKSVYDDYENKEFDEKVKAEFGDDALFTKRKSINYVFINSERTYYFRNIYKIFLSDPFSVINIYDWIVNVSGNHCVDKNTLSYEYSVLTGYRLKDVFPSIERIEEYLHYSNIEVVITDNTNPGLFRRRGTKYIKMSNPLYPSYMKKKFLSKYENYSVRHEIKREKEISDLEAQLSELKKTRFC